MEVIQKHIICFDDQTRKCIEEVKNALLEHGASILLLEDTLRGLAAANNIALAPHVPEEEERGKKLAKDYGEMCGAAPMPPRKAAPPAQPAARATSAPAVALPYTEEQKAALRANINAFLAKDRDGNQPKLQKWLKDNRLKGLSDTPPELMSKFAELLEVADPFAAP